MSKATANVVIRSEEKGKHVYEQLQSRLNGLTKSMRIFSGVAGAAAVGGLASLTKRSFESVDALAKHADRIGESTTRLKALQHLTELTGGSSGNLTKSLVKAQKALGEFNATGSGTATPFLRKLNVDTRELAQLKPGELFEVYAEKIRNMGTRAEQTAASAALFGDRTGEMLNLIDAGPQSLRDIQNEVERYGIALDRVDSAKIEAANDAMFRVRERMSGVGNIIASRVAPVVTAIANRFLDSGVEADAMGNIVDKVMNGIASAAGIVADAFFGWEIIFQGAKVVALNLWQSMVGGMAKVEQAIIRVRNKMSEAFGGDTIDVNDGPLTKMENSLKETSTHATRVLQELIASERPSEAISRKFDELRVNAENAAQATAKAREKISSIETPEDGETVDQERAREKAELEEQRLREQLQGKLETIEGALRSEEEAEIFAHGRRMEIVKKALDSELITKDRYRELEQQLSTQHEDKISEIAKKGLSEREEFEAKSGKQKAKQILGDLKNISSSVASHNKAMFQINKAAAIASAVINTHQGVTKTLANYPMPWAAVLAAAHLAQGVAQINSIRSQQFGGGGTTPSAIGAAPAASTAPTANDFRSRSGQSSVPTTEPPDSTITIIVEGSLIGDEGVKRVIGDAIGDMIENDQIIIPANSRQAVEIRNGTGAGG